MAAKQVKKQLPKEMEAHKFPKGVSGNPNGRPKGRAITTLLQEELEKIDKSTGKAKKVMLAEKLLELATSGNIKAIEIVLERTEGKVAQPITGESGGPISVEYKDARAEILKRLSAYDPKTKESTDHTGDK